MPLTNEKSVVGHHNASSDSRVPTVAHVSGPNVDCDGKNGVTLVESLNMSLGNLLSL